MANISFGKSDFQFVQLDEEFELCNASFFNQTSGCNVGIKTKLNLREVILMESQSTMDLFCNRALAENNTKSKTKIRLKRNDGTMTVSHQSMANCHHKNVWFSEYTITNIVALRNLRI